MGWSRSPSSRGPGHRPLTAVTGVRIPYGTPLPNKTGNCVSGRRESAVDGRLRERGSWPLYADLVIANDDFVDEQAQVRLAGGGVVPMQSLAEGGGEAGDAVAGDRRGTDCAPGIERAHALDRGLAGEFRDVEPVLQRRIPVVHEPLLDQFQQPTEPALRLGQCAPRIRRSPTR